MSDATDAPHRLCTAHADLSRRPRRQVLHGIGRRDGLRVIQQPPAEGGAEARKARLRQDSPRPRRRHLPGGTAPGNQPWRRRTGN